MYRKKSIIFMHENVLSVLVILSISKKQYTFVNLIHSTIFMSQ